MLLKTHTKQVDTKIELEDTKEVKTPAKKPAKKVAKKVAKK